MSTRYPGAVWRPQVHYEESIEHNAIILHTMVGYLESTDAMFRHDSSYSHFGVGGQWGGDVAQHLDGVVYQWQDLDYRAEANVDGNPYTISIETADNAPQTPAEIEPWTPHQLDAIVNLCAWLCRRYGIPAVKLPDTRAESKGIGYHEMGAHWNLKVAGALYYGDHSCPGPIREAQVVDVVIPRVAGLLSTDGATAIPTSPAAAGRATTTPTPTSEAAMLITYEGHVLLWNLGSTRDSVTVLTNPEVVHDLADHGVRWVKPTDAAHKAYLGTLATILGKKG